MYCIAARSSPMMIGAIALVDAPPARATRLRSRTTCCASVTRRASPSLPRMISSAARAAAGTVGGRLVENTSGRDRFHSSSAIVREGGRERAERAKRLAEGADHDIRSGAVQRRAAPALGPIANTRFGMIVSNYWFRRCRSRQVDQRPAVKCTDCDP